MGYETRLIIGKSSSLTGDEIQRGELVIEDGEAYRPMLKNAKGEHIKTGRKETWFQVMAEIDLCKCGSESKIHEIDRVNRDEGHIWYWFSSGDGNTRMTEDFYGDKPKPVPIKEVVAALEADVARDDDRRFKWALALLMAMQGDPEGLSVLIFGH